MKILGAILLGVVLILFVAALLGFPTMWLWNDICPELFGLKQLTFWQALELNVLCGILFKASYTTTKKE